LTNERAILIYCIDTSALIDLWRDYPIDIFPSLLEEIEKLMSDEFLIAPKQVLDELEKIDDDLLKWVKKHKKMFINLDAEQIQLVKDILSKFPNLIDATKTIPDADPFIIALASSKNCIVITSEKPSSVALNKFCKSFIATDSTDFHRKMNKNLCFSV
jgi:succinate dehydrogenase flavin-adding protein (antitoxin of CptAB toxin-antitoxin module)